MAVASSDRATGYVAAFSICYAAFLLRSVLAERGGSADAAGSWGYAPAARGYAASAKRFAAA